MFLLDTNICIALLNGKDEALPERMKRHQPEDFCLTSLVKAELWYGARHSQHVNRNLETLKIFFSQFESLVFDDKCAEQYGLLRAQLSKAGTPIGANDLVIASVALSHDIILVTRNRSEFSRVPGLRLEAW